MKEFLRALAILLSPACLAGQPVLPSWLLTYPGATVTRQNLSAMSAASFTTADQPDAVFDYYRQAFDQNGLSYKPTSNRLAKSIRADADCGDLTISIMSSGTGSSVHLRCSVKFQPHAIQTTGNFQQDSAAAMERHRQAAAEMGIGRARPAAPAPPLEWPAWLVKLDGTLPDLHAGSDPAGNGTIKTQYISRAPMSQIFAFYKDLLTANHYLVNRGGVTTGQTMSGVKQNASGEVEGYQYPDGSPGPRTEIHVTFSRMNLNDPIKVYIRFTTFAYAGSPGLAR